MCQVFYENLICSVSTLPKANFECADVQTKDELLRYNKLGNNSAKEIMRKIFEYHYNHLPEDKVQEYEKRLAQLNNSV